MHVQLIVELLAAVKEEDEASILQILKEASNVDNPSLFAALMRQSIFWIGKSPLYYRRLRNLWETSGKPQLKSVATARTIQILSDGTVDTLAPYLELFLAAYGVTSSIKIGAFDSVEFEAHAGPFQNFDLTLVVLSENWLRKSVGGFPASRTDLEAAQASMSSLARALAARRSGAVAFSTFYSGAWAVVASSAQIDGKMSWSRIVAEMNATVAKLGEEGILAIDTQQALHAAGGASAVGAVSAIRMRAPFEETGFLALAREAASTAAQLFGRGHRALLTDWDNTIWGGEVGEIGPEGIEVGPETPDGYGYQLLQSYMADLNALGIALAAVSRNDPNVSEVLELNKHLPLRRENYAALELSWGNKSESVARVIKQLNFGSDFMVYIDDNHVDLAEVVAAFPEIDVILAGPEPDQSLSRLAGARFFNSAQVTSGDLHRKQQMASLRAQRDAKLQSQSGEDFLGSLGIEVSVCGLTRANRDRVLQLMQKTNQFNVTTRRHNKEDVDRLVSIGSHFGVFEYSDRFGSQGIIGLVILVPTDRGAEIDTWLMSCRVLNRNVERAMLRWAVDKAGKGKLFGTYIPTQKNELVRELYPTMGFRPVGAGEYELDLSDETN